jgi:hypothetical protein
MAGPPPQFNNRRRKAGRLSYNKVSILLCTAHPAHLTLIDGKRALMATVPQHWKRTTQMTYGKTLTLTLAAGAMALASFTAAPARADDQQLLTFLAGAAAIAIIANADNDNHRGYYRGNRWDDHRDRWHHGNRRYGYGNGYGDDWNRGYNH